MSTFQNKKIATNEEKMEDMEWHYRTMFCVVALTIYLGSKTPLFATRKPYKF